MSIFETHGDIRVARLGSLRVMFKPKNGDGALAPVIVSNIFTIPEDQRTSPASEVYTVQHGYQFLRQMLHDYETKAEAAGFTLDKDVPLLRVKG